MHDEIEDATDEVIGRLPGRLGALVEAATETHTLTLAAGLAFFGLVSVPPAIGFVLGVLRLVTGDGTADGLANAVEEAFPQALGLADLVDQMQDRAGRYAGVALVILLWPATTLASGWTRALDAVNNESSTGGVRGLRGRLRGLVLGGLLLGGLLVFLTAAATVTTVAGAAGGVVVVFGFCLAAYRWLPSDTHPLRSSVPGALLATGGIVVATAAFGLVLGSADALAQHYPPALYTAVVLGFWLYLANVALLLGDQYNALRRGPEAHENGPRSRTDPVPPSPWRTDPARTRGPLTGRR